MASNVEANDPPSQTGVSFRKRNYAADFPGPFLVMAEALGESTLAPTTIAKWIIKEFDRDFVKATAISKRKMKILMRSAEAANRLVSMTYNNLRFNIPQRLVETLAVTHIELDVAKEELNEAKAFDKGKSVQINNPEILEIRRVMKRGEGGDIPLTTVIVTFSGLALPTHIELNRVLYYLKPYVYPIRQCRNCWRLGHHQKQCKSKKRCEYCVEKNVDANHNCDQAQPRCVNCDGTHSASDAKTCPNLKRQKELDRNRQTSFSQGPTDWFSAMGKREANPTLVISPPDVESPQTPIRQTQSNHHVLQLPYSDAGSPSNTASSPESLSDSRRSKRSKRASTGEMDDDDIIPTLELHVEDQVCNAIGESLKSRNVEEMLEKLQDPGSGFSEQQFLEQIESFIRERVTQYIGSLRL